MDKRGRKKAMGRSRCRCFAVSSTYTSEMERSLRQKSKLPRLAGRDGTEGPYNLRPIMATWVTT